MKAVLCAPTSAVALSAERLVCRWWVAHCVKNLLLASGGESWSKQVGGSRVENPWFGFLNIDVPSQASRRVLCCRFSGVQWQILWMMIDSGVGRIYRWVSSLSCNALPSSSSACRRCIRPGVLWSETERQGHRNKKTTIMTELHVLTCVWICSTCWTPVTSCHVVSVVENRVFCPRNDMNEFVRGAIKGRS